MYRQLSFLYCSLAVTLLAPVRCLAADLSGEEDGSETARAEEMLEEELDFDAINETLEEIFPEEKMDFGETVRSIVTGDLSVSVDLLGQLLSDQLFYALQVNRESLVHMLLIAVIAAMFTNFADVFQARQISEISFYVLYILMIALCLGAFQSAAAWVEDGIRLLTAFMKALCPVYFIAVSLAKGSMTAAAFYNLALLVILLVEVFMVNFLLPALHVYMMIKVLNYLSQEEYLSRFTELIETVVSWTLKTLLALVIGLNTIQGLIAPAVDSVKRSALTRGVEAIPGVGDAIGGTAEVILGTAVVVKNGIGIAGAIICFALCAVPLVQAGIMVLMYKLAAAVLQPVSDKKAGGLYWRHGRCLPASDASGLHSRHALSFDHCHRGGYHKTAHKSRRREKEGWNAGTAV